MTTHACHRASGDVTVHPGSYDDCGICANLAAKGLLAFAREDAATGGQAPASEAAEDSTYTPADPLVTQATKEFAEHLLHLGFVPSAAAKIVEALPPLLASVGSTYRHERHQQILELVGYLGGKLMDDFLPQAGEVGVETAYDVGFQTGVACAYTVAASGTAELPQLVDPDNYRRVRAKALEAAADGKLQEVILEEDEEKEPE